MTNIENKIAQLSELWVRWNIKEITGNDFAVAFREEFHHETSQAWDEKMNPKKVLKKKIEKIHREKLCKRIRNEMVIG